MKHILSFSLALAVLASCGPAKQAVATGQKPVETKADDIVSPTNLIIMYDTKVGKDPLMKAVKEYKADLIYDYNVIPGVAVKIPEGTDIQEAITYFKGVKGVVTVERDRVNNLTDPVQPRK